MAIGAIVKPEAGYRRVRCTQPESLHLAALAMHVHSSKRHDLLAELIELATLIKSRAEDADLSGIKGTPKPIQEGKTPEARVVLKPGAHAPATPEPEPSRRVPRGG